MNTDFEPVMAAQFAALEAAATLNFTGNAAANSAVISAVADLPPQLFVGLPVFGPGVPQGATVQAFDPEVETITLTAPIGAAAEGAAFTTGFQTTDRRKKHWSEVAAQPALFFCKVGVTTEVDPESYFSINTLECEIWIYANSGQNPDAVPDTQLGILDQMVRATFAPDGAYGENRFTLGGRVWSARIEGRADYWDGDQGPQAVAHIPVRITLP